MNNEIKELIEDFKEEFDYLDTKEKFIGIINEELRSREEDSVGSGYVFFEDIPNEIIQLMKKEIIKRKVNKKVIVKEEW